MLAHLSKTSPYLCDLSLGPIEQANRMASAPTKRLFPFLQQTRTPLKLLAPDEVPMDESLTTAVVDASLQPVWYSERTRSTLPAIDSDGADEVLLDQPSLMRKSSTFTLPSALNDSEKENDANIVITSTQKEVAPSDESFRALEHLLGLGSTNINLTMTTTTHESPKSNHDTLSLTIVTPTELINNSTATSFHLSYAPTGGGSLPSSQNILLMPTIESITEPSMNSTVPPPFSVDNSDMEEEEEGVPSPSTAEETLQENFSADQSIEIVARPLITVRAPTSADVAYRALVKARTSGRFSQPVTRHSPLAQPSETHERRVDVSDSIPLTVRSSFPALPSREPESVTASADDADRSASSDDAPPTPSEPLYPVLSREFTYNTPTAPSTRRRTTRSCLPALEEPSGSTSEEDESMARPMLSILSTNPTVMSEAPAIVLQKSLAGSASPSPVIGVRSSEPLSPRRSIYPLHSSTPSTRKNPSLQMVSIGEEEQVSTTAPSQLKIDSSVEEEVQTSPQRVDIAVQTTPSLDPSSRRRFQSMEQQTSPVATRSSSACQTTPVPIAVQRDFPQQITPIHRKAMMHLRRNVRFQFTPSTDARLAAKEKEEEEEGGKYRKKEIVIIPVEHETLIISDHEREEETEDETRKAKTKKKKQIPPSSKTDESSEDTVSSFPSSLQAESPTRRRDASNNDTTTLKKKRSARLEKKASPLPEPAVIVLSASPVKRTNRKRSNPKNTSPTEPVTKRVKTTAPKKSKKTSAESSPVESTTNKRKNVTSGIKKGKRRLHSVEQDEGLNTADEEEEVISLTESVPIDDVNLSPDEREKIEASTVAELKSRLIGHGETIPKGLRKADLVALLLKIELQLLKEKRPASIAEPEETTNPTSRRTRRKK